MGKVLLWPDSGKPHVPYAWIADMLRADGAKRTKIPCRHVLVPSWFLRMAACTHVIRRGNPRLRGKQVAGNVAWSKIGNRADDSICQSAICNLHAPMSSTALHDLEESSLLMPLRDCSDRWLRVRLPGAPLRTNVPFEFLCFANTSSSLPVALITTPHLCS